MACEAAAASASADCVSPHGAAEPMSDLDVLYRTAVQHASPAEKELVQAIHDLGRYPKRYRAKVKTEEQRREHNLSVSLSKKRGQLGQQCHAYMEAMRAAAGEERDRMKRERAQDLLMRVRSMGRMPIEHAPSDD